MAFSVLVGFSLILLAEPLTVPWAMPNPSGVNSFDKFGTQATYGAVKKATDLAGGAPLSGAPNAAVSAPKRAQRAAVSHKRGQGQGKSVDYPTFQAQWWTDTAATPGVSPLVMEYAMKAQQRLANGSS
jgi:hypothetical protein